MFKKIGQMLYAQSSITNPGSWGSYYPYIGMTAYRSSYEIPPSEGYVKYYHSETYLQEIDISFSDFTSEAEDQYCTIMYGQTILSFPSGYTDYLPTNVVSTDPTQDFMRVVSHPTNTISYNPSSYVTSCINMRYGKTISFDNRFVPMYRAQDEANAEFGLEGYFIFVKTSFTGTMDVTFTLQGMKGRLETVAI